MRVNINGMKNLNRGRILNDKMRKSMEKLASGLRINRAGDDAAGLSVSEKLRIEMSEQEQSVQNVRHGANLARTADAALQEVNDMMKRAETLCLQAANGTYSEQERQELTDELNELYDEMERIFSSAEFNDIKLFQYNNEDEVGDFPHQFKEYIESVEVLQTGQTAVWGELDIIGGTEKLFNRAQAAQAASVTMQLDNEVNLNDASTLNGKSFYLIPPGSSHGFHVTFAEEGKTSWTDAAYYEGKYCYEFVIGTKDRTVQEAMDALCATLQNGPLAQSVKPESIKVDATGKMTMTFDTSDLVQTLDTGSYLVSDGSGTASNNSKVASVEWASLGQVDQGDNKMRYSDKIVGSVTLLGELTAADTVLTEAQAAAIRGSGLAVELTGKDPINIDLSGVTAGKTVSEARTLIAEKIKELNQFDAAVNGDGSITITKSGSSTSDLEYVYVEETATAGTTVASKTPTVTVNVKEAATPEKAEVCTITMSNTELPLTLNVNGTTLTFCQSKSYTSYSATSGSVYSVSDIEDIANVIRAYCDSDKMTCSVENGVITVTGKYAGEKLNISVTQGQSVDVTPQTRVLMSYDRVFSQVREIPLDLSAMVKDDGSLDLTALDGKGFSLKLSSKELVFEFCSDPAKKTVADAHAVDFSGCTTLDDVKDKLKQELGAAFNNSAFEVVRETGSSRFLIQHSSTMTMTDGPEEDGLFNNEAGIVSGMSSGGTDATQPGTTIDFSSYNPENFDELYGSGFRVTCATCEDEYINVMFCYDKAELSIPEDFELMDENGNHVLNPDTDLPIKIKNCVVELKGMSDGADIVRSIVTQLDDSLKHFTEMAVGNPSSVLIVRDKRQGDIYINGVHKQAQVLSGVKTNFIYDLTINKLTNPDALIAGPDSGVDAHYGYCTIYAGDNEGKAEWVAVHLPNLSLNKLNLDPPRPDLTKVETISDVLDRLKVADQVVSMARGQLGADQNRLDHAKNNLTNAAEQTADSYSRIRDLDMAEGMTEQVKLNILQQSQQSALAHINQQASEVLKLMQ